MPAIAGITAGGVMVAASFWSLLNPAIEMAERMGVPGWLPAAVGFALGALFIFALDKVLPQLIEFWQGMPSRLHRRERYTRDGDGWRMRWVYP